VPRVLFLPTAVASVAIASGDAIAAAAFFLTRRALRENRIYFRLPRGVLLARRCPNFSWVNATNCVFELLSQRAIFHSRSAALPVRSLFPGVIR